MHGITVTARVELPDNPSGPRVALVDFGGRDYLIHALAALGCHITLLPPNSTFEEIMQCAPAGILLSDGPGDPRELTDIRLTLARILALEEPLPLMGVGLGHQLIGLALGGQIRPMTPGHRGANHPVRDISSDQNPIHITTQNHGFALEEPFSEKVEITHIHLNDHSIEGLACPSRSVFSLQFVPETQPGPHTTHYLYQRFCHMLSK
jgi:carbamoyl-phosphate synthase small subunit